MKLVPFIRPDGLLIDGVYIKAISFCKNNCQKKTCLSFYKGLVEKNKNQFYTCPHGMSVYVNSDGRLFSCLRERKTYNKLLALHIASKEDVYNPILDSDQLLKLVEISTALDKEEDAIIEKRASVESISHEVKQLNAQIKDRSDIILQSYNLNEEGTIPSNDDIQKLRKEIRSIFVSSSMIASRFLLYDYEKNPEVLSQGTIFPCVVYNKFYKIKKILKNYKRKNVIINIYGNSYAQIMAYPSFEMIPLLIIENAVKYTYGTTNSVDITFREEPENELIITVDSYSPYCSEQESTLIFTKGFRSKNAQRTSDGSGIGLYFVKMLCDLHNIEVHATSDSSKVTEVSGVAYAPFRISLRISNTFLES
jgi:light-regulated signal transduction histidine kinase (bacteriophytochrome)